MESETQTSKHLNVVDIIKKLHTYEPLPSIKQPDQSKPVFPYIEFYNSLKKHKKRTPVFLLNYHQKLFSLNKKIKAKELAHIHHYTLQSNESVLTLNSSNHSMSNRKSRYIHNKDFNVSKSVEAKKVKDFERLLIVGVHNVNKTKDSLPSHLKLPSLAEVLNSGKFIN